MGDPKFPRRKYDRPSHPWDGERIKAENELLNKYGLKNKKELWRAQSFLSHIRARARELQALVRYGNKQAEKERDELIARLGRLGLLPVEGATLDDVLALDVEAVLSRRLQTMVYVKGLSFNPRQARQFIVHGHLAVGGRAVRAPGRLVSRAEEASIVYDARSPIANDLHPARPRVQEITVPAGDAPKGDDGGGGS
ncbi:MAG TPA: 30S ribosomal protein S4 [Thermoplasmata archaeon]|nr:30S ribosomal protein S4 [Thermoplasmata archaeon]